MTIIKIIIACIIWAIAAGVILYAWHDFVTRSNNDNNSL